MKKIYNAVIAILLLVVVFIVGINGFTLADANASSENIATKDSLIGVFLTKEYLDLFDTESWLNDLGGALSEGDELTISDNTSAYEGKLYASIVDKELSGTSDPVIVQDYIFEGIDGIGYYCPTVIESGETYTTTNSDDGITDIHMNVSQTDDGTTVTQEGTLYITPDLNNENTVFYFNPVYQTADGSVYALSGHGISTGGIEGEGITCSQTLSDSTSVTENGATMTNTTTIKITIKTMSAPKQVCIIEMNQDNQSLAIHNYAPDSVPETITPQTDTAYLIVKSMRTDSTGNTITSHEIYDSKDHCLETFSSRPDGICIKSSTEILWNK